MKSEPASEQEINDVGMFANWFRAAATAIVFVGFVLLSMLVGKIVERLM